MNKDQRNFLITKISETCNKQIKVLEDEREDKPNLNNWLVAGFLDGTIQFTDIKILAEKMKQRVLKMDRNDVLLKEESDSFYNRKRKEEENLYVHLRADELFVIPQGYLDELKIYEENEKAIDEKIKILEAQKDTIVMKLQIGSNEQLKKLIDEADNLVDLSLVNSQLLLKN